MCIPGIPLPLASSAAPLSSSSVLTHFTVKIVARGTQFVFAGTYPPALITGNALGNATASHLATFKTVVLVGAF